MCLGVHAKQFIISRSIYVDRKRQGVIGRLSPDATAQAADAAAEAADGICRLPNADAKRSSRCRDCCEDWSSGETLRHTVIEKKDFDLKIMYFWELDLRVSRAGIELLLSLDIIYIYKLISRDTLPVSKSYSGMAKQFIPSCLFLYFVPLEYFVSNPSKSGTFDLQHRWPSCLFLYFVSLRWSPISRSVLSTAVHHCLADFPLTPSDTRAPWQFISSSYSFSIRDPQHHNMRRRASMLARNKRILSNSIKDKQPNFGVFKICLV